MAGKPRNVETNESGTEAGAKNFESKNRVVESESLEPISKVVRELTSPDGTVLRVEVPVYPPFRLKGKAESAAAGQ